MSDERAELKAVLEAIAHERRHGDAAHLSVDELITYARGGMQPDNEINVQEHLAWCAQCTEALLSRGALADLEHPTAATVSDAQVSLAWEELKRTLRRHFRAERPRRERRPGIHVFARFNSAHAIAASLVVALVLVGAWSISRYQASRPLTVAVQTQSEFPPRATPAPAVADAREAREPGRVEAYERQIAQLEQQVAALSEPQPNLLIADLYPVDAIRGSARASTTIVIPSGANVFAVILNGVTDRSYPDYRVDIFDRLGTKIWSGGNLRKTEFGNFTLALPRRLLPAGEYRLRLQGVNRSRVTLLEQYSIVVQE